MNYTDMFNKFFIIVFIIYVLILLGIIFVCASDVPFQQDVRVKNSLHYNKIKIFSRIGLVGLYIIITIFAVLPIYKDKKFLSQNTFKCTHGVVYQEVLDGGVLGLFKTIIIEVDGNDVEYNVLYVEKNIKKGDMVKVTYLPNSMYAIIEMD